MASIIFFSTHVPGRLYMRDKKAWAGAVGITWDPLHFATESLCDLRQVALPLLSLSFLLL